ncbi:MAG: hypothetical protein A2Z16_01660 [Chloroflexi bacterium RBG_16_54_18]|nr:MAG: hypothetical protein A2Z16_01660 [Chloroflexi bacterium RBG_16_54_18]
MNEQDLLFKRAQERFKAARILILEDLPNIAASRAYYALFYVAEALLLDRGLTFSSHSAVIAAFGKEFSRTNDLDPKFHRYLIAAQDTRQIGDYGINKDVATNAAEELVEWAEEFFKVAIDYLRRK